MTAILPMSKIIDNAPETNGWGEPQKLSASIVPEKYPLDALPPIMRDAIAEVQSFTQAPAPLVACSALAALSTAVQALADVRRAEGLQGLYWSFHSKHR